MSKRKMSAAEARRNDEKKEEGREAFEKGDPVESCPYQSAFNSDRWAWIWGWQEKERIKKDKEDADAWFLAEAGRRGFVPNPAPTPEAADTAPAGQPTEEELERMAAMAVEDGIAIDRLTRYAPAPASPGEAPADLREAVAIQLAEFWTSARCGKWKWKDFDFDDRHAFYKDADKILALVHPQAHKAAPPQPQAQPSEAHACPFCKHTLKSRDGFYTCSNRACSFPLGIAPTPTAGAPTLAADPDDPKVAAPVMALFSAAYSEALVLFSDLLAYDAEYFRAHEDKIDAIKSALFAAIHGAAEGPAGGAL